MGAMEQAIVATEIFGAIILIVIIYGVMFETKQKSKKRTSFLNVCFVSLCTVVFDMVTYLPVSVRSDKFLFVTTLISFVLPYAVYSLFLQYLYVSVSAKIVLSDKCVKYGLIYSALAIAACLLNSINGKLFYIDDSVYHAGEYYNFYLGAYMILMIYILVIVIINYSKIGFHDSVAAFLFILIPIVFIVINIIWEDMAFSMASLSIDMLVMYIMLQADRENDLLSKESDSLILAHRDELTGLQNRLAYAERCDQMNSDDTIGVVFCDVNGLKYTNDHFGHAAGDKLICDFADMLRVCFEKESIYRISGDEFVVLVNSRFEDAFAALVYNLCNTINAVPIAVAAVGSAFGSESEIKRLVDIAETNMYEDKKAFKLKHPERTRIE